MLNPKTSLLMAVMISSAAILSVTYAGGATQPEPFSLEIVDIKGQTHLITSIDNNKRIPGAGLPFDDNITDDYNEKGDDFWSKSPRLRRTIAIDYHDLTTTNNIIRAALNRGVSKFNADIARVVLLVPLDTVNHITFQTSIAKGQIHSESTIQLSNGELFSAGAGFSAISGREKLGSLGMASFSIGLDSVRSIRRISPSPSASPNLALDFGFFSVDANPFSVTVVDLSGERIYLQSALYLGRKSFSVPNKDNNLFFEYPNETITTVNFSSLFDAKINETSEVAIPSDKLRKLIITRVSGPGSWFTATATLKNGEVYNLVYSGDGAGMDTPNGILGISGKGWVWIPWYVVSSLEFR